MYKIGLAEDDERISTLVSAGLEEQGYEVVLASNGVDALQHFAEEKMDLIILDIMMPGLNGIDVCRLLRLQQPAVPILMLTAIGTIEDKLNAFHAGGDDYLVKPFHFQELLARISALLKRSTPNPQAQSSEILSFEDMQINTSSKEVHRSGKVISLTAKEFTLLELFMRNPNRLLSRQYIAEHAWDINFDTGTNVIDVYINFLRNKIDREFDRKLIHTKINMGYILK